ncbi:hypothetical protein ES708_19496 [subsurface metagenome]
MKDTTRPALTPPLLARPDRLSSRVAPPGNPPSQQNKEQLRRQQRDPGHLRAKPVVGVTVDVKVDGDLGGKQVIKVSEKDYGKEKYNHRGGVLLLLVLIEYFVKPATGKQWFDYWVEERVNWYVSLGIKRENLKLRPHDKEELAHYARECSDINYLFPMGWAELEGIANRGDFDLVQHASASGKGLSYYDEENKEHIVPYIIEPSAGVDRTFLALLCDAYDEDEAEGEKRVLLHLHPDLAPIKAAVLPLSRKEPLASFAKEIYADLRPQFMVQYDDAQSIGRRYRRQDEIGTPFCVTVDFESLEDKQVTIRERDSLNQIRVPIDSLKVTLQAKLGGEDLFVLPPGGKIWKE